MWRQGIKRETNFAHIAHTTCQVTSECNDFNHHFWTVMSLFVGSVCWKCDIALCMIDNTYMLLTFHKQQLIFLPFQWTICSETLVWMAVLVSSTQVCEIYPNWHAMKHFCYFYGIQKPNKCVDKSNSRERRKLRLVTEALSF